MHRKGLRKRATAFVLAAALGCVAPFSAAALSDGDLDGNGVVNMRDTLVLFQHVGLGCELTAEQTAAADLDGDGAITMRDGLKLFRVAAGLDHQSPPEDKALTPISIEEYYGRQLLLEAGKMNMVAAYDHFGTCVAQLDEDISVKEYRLTILEMQQVVQCYGDDHPEMFWQSGYEIQPFEEDGVLYSDILLPKYSYDAAEIKELEERLAVRTAELLEGLTDETPELEREKTVHDRLLRSAVYDNSCKAPHTRDLAGVMLYGTGVCESYAGAFQYLMQQCGIPTAIAHGRVKGNENHMWNVVKIDDAWYHVDATWNDPDVKSSGSKPLPLTKYVRYDYFNITTARILADHEILPRTSSVVEGEELCYPLPVCRSTEAYWVSEAAVELRRFDVKVAGEALAEAVRREDYVYFRPVGSYTMAKLKADLQDANCFWGMIDEANAILGDHNIEPDYVFYFEDATEGIYGVYLYEQ